MALVSQAEHARRCKVSRKSVTVWKAAGKLTMVGDLVDHEASYKGEGWHAGVRKTREAGPTAGERSQGAKPARESRASAASRPHSKAQAPTAATGPDKPGQADAPEIVPNGASALKEAVVRKEEYAGRLRELEYRRKAGQVIEIEVARAKVFDLSREMRDAWLNWVPRNAPLIAADLGVEADRVAEVLTGYVHRQLARLGNPDGAFRQA